MADANDKLGALLAGGEPAGQVQPRARARTIEHPEYPALLDDLRGGAFFEVACAARGINWRSVLAACEDDEDAAMTLAMARAEGTRARLKRVEDADAKLWAREAWLLERHSPKGFHLPTKVTGVPKDEGGAPISVERQPASREAAIVELEQLHAEIGQELAKRKAGV
jgi:hypothetical protein